MEESKIVLRSVFGKVGMKYYIQPCRDKNGNWPECVKQVDSFGNMMLFVVMLFVCFKANAQFVTIWFASISVVGSNTGIYDSN